MLSRADVGSLFGYARSYFHVDLPVVSAAITLLRSFMPRKPVDELYTVLGRAKQGKTERYFALQRHLDKSIDSFVHAPGERGLVMIVFTLPSHDLVFKVIRDRFGAPKTTTRADVIERYQFVFRHDRAGRLVDAQEFKRLRLPRARFMPDLADELLREASESCRVEGEDLIVEHCYIERRLRPLNLFLREAEPAAAESAIIDYGNALRDLAASNVFPGDLLLKNFGVTSHGRVIFYDYDEICLVSDCVFRDLPRARTEEEETSAEPWFHCGPRDVFPEHGCRSFPYHRALQGIRATAPLERCGAIVSRSLHVTAGQEHQHSSELARWDQAYRGSGGGTGEDPVAALRDLIAAAVRAAVLAPETELRRWFSWPWYWADSLVDDLIGQGRLRRIDDHVTVARQSRPR